MANTTNLNLGKLSGSEKLKTFPTMQAGNMDAIDAAFGSGFGVGTASDVNSELNSLGDGLAIIANGNTHAAITSGQFVYVRKHSSLTDGLYTANSNISANATLSSSNLTASSGGGLNSVYASLNSNIENMIPQKIIESETLSTTKTLNIGNNCRACIDYVVNNVASCFSIDIVSNSSGIISMLEKAKGSSVTFDTTTANKLIIGIGTTARTGYFFIQASTKAILNGITLA